MADAEGWGPSRLTGIVSGRFRILRVVARGGMAEIYEAEDLKSGRRGALKLLQRRFREVPAAVERLGREASAAGRIAHPHIVQTLDAGRFDSGEPFLFMELLAGESLDRVLACRGPLPVALAVEIALQATRGLCAAHEAVVLHRDIKPANLFLLAGPECHVKLLDFGVSKLVVTGLQSLTQEGLPLGTFSYMPPEQMMGAKRVDGRADLYSLGVVLYECLAGRPPFLARSIRALSNLMAQNTCPLVSELRPEVPPELAALLVRLLRANPKERPETARVLCDELAALLRDPLDHATPIAARPASSALQPQRTLSIGEPARAAAAPPPEQKPAPRSKRAPRPRGPLVETIIPRSRKLS
ncbi:MAG TPA: serine/threonine-protein kinase [Polyangiaceae bacterium]|nr:serine/threonine-protein kinase [Polyangiaceae bacterium]